MFESTVKKRFIYSALKAHFLLLGLVVSSCQSPDIKRSLNQSGLSTSLQGRHYYLLQPGFTCRTQAEGAEVPSYADSLYFHHGEMIQTGSACNDSLKGAPLNLVSDLQVAHDMSFVVYEGKQYKYLPEWPAQD